MSRAAPIIPYSQRHEAFCPYCGALDTEYHPTIRWGRCHAPGCGRAWRFPPYTKPLEYPRLPPARP